MTDGTTNTLRGELTAWRPHQSGTGWGTGTVRTDEGRSVDVVGTLVGARVGDTLDAVGVPDTHPRYGEQFRVTRVTISAPVSLDGVARWLAATLPGVGPTRARAIVEHFGGVDAMWHALEHAPERLSEVAGITDARARDIRQVWITARDDREHQVSLRAWGLTDGQIGRCVTTWGTAARACEVIRADPYELYRRVAGFGWMRADVVAQRTRIARDAPTRIASALTYTLEQHAAKSGHVWMRAGVFQQQASDLLRVDKSTVYMGIVRALADGTITKRRHRVYLTAYERAESELARGILERCVT